MTPAIREYAEKKVKGLEKFIRRMDESVQAWGKGGHDSAHLKGDVYRAEIQIHIPHYGKGELSDLPNSQRGHRRRAR